MKRAEEILLLLCIIYESIHVITNDRPREDDCIYIYLQLINLINKLDYPKSSKEERKMHGRLSQFLLLYKINAGIDELYVKLKELIDIIKNSKLEWSPIFEKYQ